MVRIRFAELVAGLVQPEVDPLHDRLRDVSVVVAADFRQRVRPEDVVPVLFHQPTFSNHRLAGQLFPAVVEDLVLAHVHLVADQFMSGWEDVVVFADNVEFGSSFVEGGVGVDFGVGDFLVEDFFEGWF